MPKNIKTKKRQNQPPHIAEYFNDAVNDAKENVHKDKFPIFNFQFSMNFQLINFQTRCKWV